MQTYLISAAFALVVVLPSALSDEVYCGIPPDIQFADLQEEPSEQYELGTVITYACQFGYTRRGKISALECEIPHSEENAKWSQPQFSCAPQSCGDPGYVNNGRRIGSLFAFPNSVKYECNEGYKLKGLSTRYCQASGLWSGKLPECEEITCPPPRDFKNGFLTFTTLDYGSELQYKCDKGFRLNTDETTFCTAEGKWSNPDVKCIESVCDMPQQPEHGSMQISGSSNKLLAGTLALFSCDRERIADGPTTSKCLESGVWTFPPPKCLEPCKIPYISNGILGGYVLERYSRRRVFREISVGTRVNDDPALYLRCSEGYEVAGTEKNEVNLSCKLGRWSHPLHCEPASCRTGPPSVQNAQAVALNLEHSGKVLYLCDDDFKKTQEETVVCDFGTWKGSPPVCKSTSCYLEQLPFPGLVKGRKSIYRHGEVFDIKCDSRYRIADADQPQLRCDEGTWMGQFPPCVAASCIQPPPEIEHGQPEVHSTFHSSIVKYTCNEPYILTKNVHIQCSFGKWEGQPPKCEDSRCHLKNLQNLAYVDVVETQSVTLSGKKLNVKCKEGYSPKPERPTCLNGKWTGASFSPCKENDCVIPVLYHGDVKELTMSEYYWSWKAFRRVRDKIYVKIPAGRVWPYGKSVHVFCHNGYSFQGTSIQNQVTTCFKGKWLPDPVCLRVGQKYIPRTTTQKPHVTTPLITEKSKTVTTPTKVSEIFVTKTHGITLEESYETLIPATEEMPTSNARPTEKECFCEYPINDENLVAHANGKRLSFKDKVKNGSVLIFRCEHIGFHRLEGVQNMKCEGCRNWHSSEFPICSEPKQGNAVIIFDNTLNVSIEGNLEAMKGKNIKLMCVAVESGLYPHWTVPSENGVMIKRERMERESYGDILYVSHLAIENADIENEGPYGCAVENNTMTFVNLLINDPNMRCPEFDEVDGINVTYDMERRVRSKAVFSCTNPDQEIIGKNVLSCQSNGDWSDAFPQCTDIKCRELLGNDLMEVSYTNDRKIGSKATFHCFTPGRRNGASFADCLENGTWSNPTPTCRTPPCLVEDISNVLPENVVPDMEDTNKTVPYNTTIKLTCAEDLIVKGNAVAKCNRKGGWIVENIQCISGCPELVKDPDSSLIILPHKNIYKLGEMITFLCPPGKSLTTQSQLIMCLKNGWSETILPDCQ